MVTEQSHRDIVFILDGHRVTGFAEDDPPVDFPAIELLTEKYGQDGQMYVMSTARRGGQFTVKLLPTSPTTKLWMRHHAEIQNGAIKNYAGSYADPNLDYDTLIRGAKLKTAPSTVVPGVTAEFVFVAQELIPEFDNANFAAAPFAPSSPGS